MKKQTTILLLLLLPLLWPFSNRINAQVTLEPGVDGSMEDITPANVSITTIERQRGLRGKNMAVTTTGVYFLASDTLSTGEELWITDGTAAGTRMIKDINVGTDGSDPKHLCAVGEMVYFSADDGTNGAELWMTDGTETGTMMVKDIFLGPGNGSAPDMLVPFKGGVLFRAKDNISTADNDKSYLWWSDGTGAGTSALHPIQPVEVPDAQGLTQIQVTGNGEKAFFVGLDDTTGQELWVTWGDSTKLVLDIGFEVDTASTVPNATVDTDVRWLYAVNDEQIFFRPYTPSYWTGDSAIIAQFDYLNNEVWVSNGEPWGTYPLGDMNDIPTADDPRISGNTGSAYPFNFDGKVFFRGSEGLTGTEMHTTDLTFGNFPLLQNVSGQSANGTEQSCWIEYQTIFDGFMYYKGLINGVDSAVTGFPRVGQELLRYNPIIGKVELVADIFVGATTSSFPREFTVANGRMYFRANTGNNQSNYELWGLKPQAEDSSSTPFKVAELSGNTFPAHLVNFQEKLIFVAKNPQKLYVYQDSMPLNPYDPGLLAAGPAVTELENPQIPKPIDSTSNNIPSYLKDYVNIYPNPVDQVLNVELTNIRQSHASIYNMEGRLVWQGKFVQGMNHLNVGHLPTGIYALFTNVKGYALPQRIVIRH